jgi:hypothetical protein
MLGVSLQDPSIDGKIPAAVLPQQFGCPVKDATVGTEKFRCMAEQNLRFIVERIYQLVVRYNTEQLWPAVPLYGWTKLFRR